MKRHVIVNLLAVTGNKVLITLSPLILVPVLIDRWPLPLYAFWVLVSTVPQFLAMGELGFGVAAGNDMTMLVARGERAAAAVVYRSARVVVWSSTVVFAVAAFAAAALLPVGVLPAHPGLSEAATRLVLLLMMLYAVVWLQASIYFAAFRCSGLFAVGDVLFGFFAVLDAGVVMAVVLGGGGPVAAAVALLVSRTSAVAILWGTVRWRVSWLRDDPQPITLAGVRALTVPALAAATLPLAQAAYLQGTVIALGVASSALAVPAFTLARTLSRVGLQLSTMPTTAIAPLFSAAVARGAGREQRALLGLSMVGSLVIALPMALLVGLLGPEIVRLWSHGVIHAPRSLTLALATAGLLGSLWTPLSNMLMAINRHARYVTVYGVGASLTAPLAYLLARRLGGTGAALAMVALDVLMLVVVAALARRYLSPLPTMREVASEIGSLVRSARGRFGAGTRRTRREA